MPDANTEFTPGPREFPSTHWSMVLRARDPSLPECRENLERLVSAYWRPVYAYIRSSWSKSNEDAKDLTQDFLSRLVEGDLLRQYDRDQGRFRFYLKGALRHFLLDQHKAEGRQKRGGGRTVVSIDDEPLPTTDGTASADELFDRVWAKTLLDRALADVRDTLQREGREIGWNVFDVYDLNPPETGELSYGEVGSRLGLSESEVKGHLKYVRLLLRDALQRGAADTVASQDELYRELNELFG